jgi:ribokinase
MSLDAIGFGSLNLDEFWEVSHDFLAAHELLPGHEYVRDVVWFEAAYTQLRESGRLMASDPGGSAANAIAALRKMGFRTGFYGATGREDAAALRLDELGRPEDLRVERLGLPAGRCLALIDRDDPGRDRALVILPNANDMVGATGLDMDYFGQARWVHLTSFVSRQPLVAQIRLVESLPSEVRLSFDPGAVYAAYGLDALERLVRRSEVFFASREELAALFPGCPSEKAARELLGLGARIVVAKMGADGIRAVLPGESVYQQAIPADKIRDRTGAGDVAAAGFLAGLMMSLNVAACLKLAAAAASRSIEGYGRSAYPGRPFLADWT